MAARARAAVVVVATCAVFALALVLGAGSPAWGAAGQQADPPVTDPPQTTVVTTPLSTDAPTTVTVAPTTTPSPPSTARRPATTQRHQYRPTSTVPRTVPSTTVPDSTTVTTTQDLLVGPAPTSTSTTTTVAAAGPSSGDTTSGGDSDPKVWAIVAGLVVVALALGFLTFRYWRGTAPVAETEVAPEAPEPAGRRRGRSRYGDLVITVPEPE